LTLFVKRGNRTLVMPIDPTVHHTSHTPHGKAHGKGFHEVHLTNLLRIDMAEELVDEIIEDMENPVMLALPQKRFVKIENKTTRTEQEGDTSETSKEEKDSRKIKAIKRMQNASERFQRQNQELRSSVLINLREQIKLGDSKDQILAKVLEFYPDPSLADEALDFLLETSDGELQEAVRAAKKDLNERYGVEVRAGRNMGTLARQYAEKELGSPAALRNMYRDIITNPREAPALFEELSKEFPYSKMKTVIDFLLHSVGADLKSKGPSISRGELHSIMSESRNMRSVLGVFQFFKSRMKMVHSSFSRNGLAVPNKLTFEIIARTFMKFLQERYPSADKALILAAELGISESTLAEIIIYTQIRDGVRQVAPNLYKSDQHKQDVLTALIGALEKLEKELEGEWSEEEEEDEET
jgi:type III secretion protein W